MLPSTHLDLGKGDDDFKPKLRWKARLSSWARAILEDKASRNIFCFLLLNLSFAFLELFYGMWSNSLGLISDSFHMFFDCTALLTGLIASVISRWGKNERFTYGYVRAEVMAGFINSLFLLFVAFFILSEAVERAFHPPHVEHERLLLISILGFLVNIVGIFVFHHGHGDGDHGHSHGGHGHSHGGSGHSHSNFSLAAPASANDHDNAFHNEFHTGKVANNHSHSHGGHGDHGHGHGHGHTTGHSDMPVSASSDQIISGVFLHILADTLGSVGVIISTLLIQHFGWMLADPLCSICISVLIGISVFPLLEGSVSILLQRTPIEIQQALPSAYQRVSSIDGVYSLQDPHFWTLCSKNFVGTIRLLVAPSSNHEIILSQSHAIFNEIGVKQLYVQIENSY